MSSNERSSDLKREEEFLRNLCRAAKASPAQGSNYLPEPPETPQNGKKLGAEMAPVNGGGKLPVNPQVVMSPLDMNRQLTAGRASDPPKIVSISCHDNANSGNELAINELAIVEENAPALEELLGRAMAKPRRGRKSVFDEQAKGKLIALLAMGLSVRQSAACLGVSHTTVQNTLKADGELSEEIKAARFQAQLEPLVCIIRESKRSWRAATWLMKYLDSKLAAHDETPDERRKRQDEEREEFFNRGREQVKREESERQASRFKELRMGG